MHLGWGRVVWSSGGLMWRHGLAHDTNVVTQFEPQGQRISKDNSVRTMGVFVSTRPAQASWWSPIAAHGQHLCIFCRFFSLQFGRRGDWSVVGAGHRNTSPPAYDRRPLHDNLKPTWTGPRQRGHQRTTAWQTRALPSHEGTPVELKCFSQTP